METWLIWSLALFVAGLLIAVAEVVLPSAGLLALAALACLVGSLFCAYQLSGMTAVILAIVEVITVPIVIVLAFKVLPKTRLGKGLMLAPPSTSSSRNASASTGLPKASPFDELIGRTGIAVSALRPSGTMELDGRRISVVSDGQLVPAGRRVRVVLVEGNRIVVDVVVD